MGRSVTLFNELIKGNDIDHDVETFEKIFLAIAENTLVKQNTTGRQKSPSKNCWMNKDTFSQQKVVNKLKQNFLKDHKNINRRMQYLNEKKKLKTMLYQVKKSFFGQKTQ